MLTRMWEVETFVLLLVGMENGVAIMEQFGGPSKLRSNNHLFEFMYKGDKARRSRRYLQSHIHCHIVHNNQYRGNYPVHRQVNQ